MRARYGQGFTLVELVIAISLGAIVMSFAAMFITGPVDAYAAQTRRATLVDSADAILRLMSRDVRRALPNSVRIARNGNIVALELLLTVDAVRYRDDDSGAPDEELDFSQPDEHFSTLGAFDAAAVPRTAGPHEMPPNYLLSVYNVGIAGADAYELANVITPPGTKITIATDPLIAGKDHVEIDPPMQFAYGSPSHRMYLIWGAMTYLCDTDAKTVRRYSGYAISSVQPTSAGDMNGASNDLVATNVDACNFAYAAGTAQRAGLVTLDMTVKDAMSDERVRLLHQVHVENVP